MKRLLSELSIDMYKSIIENNPDAIFVFSIDGIIMEVNQVGTKMLGYIKEEVQGIHYQEILVPKYVEPTNQQFAKILQGTSCEFETQVLHKNEGIIYLQVKNIPLMDNGEIIGIFSVCKDMTELHKTKASFNHMEERVNALFNSTGDAIDILDVDGNVVYVNPAFEKIYGWTCKEIIGKPLPIIPLYRLTHQENMLEQVKRGNAINGLETTCMNKEGTNIEVSLTISPIRDMNGNIVGTSGITRDITKQKQLENSLKESEKRYKRLVEHSPEPIIVYQGGFIQYANPSCIKLLGAVYIEDLIGKSITDYFELESVHLIEKRIRESFQIGVPVPPTEEKLMRLDGTVIDLEVTGITINHEGKPAFLMMYHDITKRKQAEEALRQSEKNYRLIAENMTDLVCVINWEGFFKYASPSHVTVLGFPSEAYEGNRARDWMHKDDFPKVRKQLDDMVKTKEGGVLEYRFRDVKGNWIWLEGKSTPVFDEKGYFRHFLVVSREITERRMHEEKLSHMAFHDTLTGLPNRRFFKERLEQALKEAERYERKMAVMFMDMDKFKHINDTLGHDAGDKILKQFSNRVQSYLLESDTIARQGGDEFIILLSEIQEEKDGIRIAKRILSSLQEPFHLDEHVIKTTTSIGIAFYPTDGITRHELMNLADTALYVAKEEGRNNYKTVTGMKRGL